MPAATSIASVIAVPLTAAAFQPFGDVVELPDRGGRLVNEGTARRIDDVASLDLTAKDGRPQLSLFRVTPLRLPIAIALLERHPLSTQTFVPLVERRFLVVAAPAGSQPVAADVRAFITDGRQGVSYASGVWHAPVIALAVETDFAVVGRAGPDQNCDYHRFQVPIAIDFDAVWSD